MRMNPITTPTLQRGAVLLISLMILLIMTVIGIAAMSTTTMEEKMAANNQQRQQALQAAETALRDAEAWMTTNVTRTANLANFNGSNGLYGTASIAAGVDPSPPAFDIYNETAWANNGVASQNLLPHQAQPRYIIEYLGEDNGEPGRALDPNDPARPMRYRFRITSIGWSVDGTARHLAMSHYARRLN